MAKTKDWGPEHAALKKLFGLKAVAQRDVNAKLLDEVARHDGTHGYGRHGAQTGWEAQMIRACTKVTPDQVFDPMGLNPSIRRWNGQTAMSPVNGSNVIDLVGLYEDEPVGHAMAAGNVAGGFLTPETQFLGRARGEKLVQTLQGSDHFCAQYVFKGGPLLIRAPLSSIKVSVTSPEGVSPYGIGFARRDASTYRNHSRAFVMACIDGFFKRQTWAQIIPRSSLDTHKFHLIARRAGAIAFPEITDLFEYFDLDILWQKSCTLIYRRDYTSASRSFGPWRLITMFPDDGEPGWAPSLWLSPAMKTAITQSNRGKPTAQKLNKNVKDYAWTGLVTSEDARRKRNYLVPSWA